MTCVHCPDSAAPLSLHVPPQPGLTCSLKHDGAGGLAQVADVPLLRQTQDVAGVEDGQTTHLIVLSVTNTDQEEICTVILLTLSLSLQTGQKVNKHL